ncbi:MAG TPA: hypothetical protein VEH55_11600 [Gaiellaceae bacterium]|jgi:hypothetical protein|nr:hypothetical protein [Gaiellaceae bacterium]
MARPRGVAVGAVAVLCALAAASAAPGGTPSVSIAPPLPEAVQGGAALTVSGRVRNPPPGAVVVLEQRASSRWQAIVRGRIRRDAFTLRWHPSAAGRITVRVALRLRAHDVVVSAAAQVLVGPAPVYCAPPAPPAQVPAGDGWVVGGLYLEGGPFPGIYQCVAGAYAITVLDQAGDTVAKQQVQDGQSYTLVLPAGSYTLSSGSCRGAATVTAGRQSRADTLCYVP